MNINVKTLTGQVEHFLRNDPPTRDSDSLLTLRIWEKFYGPNLTGFASDILNRDNSGALQNFRELPSQDQIKRYRATFNSQGKYYPTSWEVAKKRGIKEDEWREKLGYPTKERTFNPTKNESYMDPQRPVPEQLPGI